MRDVLLVCSLIPLWGIWQAVPAGLKAGAMPGYFNIYEGMNVYCPFSPAP